MSNIKVNEGEKMHTANLENCKELHELSGWTGTHFSHEPIDDGKYEVQDGIFGNTELHLKGEVYKNYPAYDLGYLLRKLPASSLVAKKLVYDKDNQQRYVYLADCPDYERAQSADTPEDAACLLAIKLFRERILKRERE